MKKVFVVGRKADHDQLLTALGELGVLHLLPVDPDRAVADEKTLAVIDETDRAIQILAHYEPAGETPSLDAAEAVAEALHLHHIGAEAHARLNILHRQINGLAAWGDVRLEQFEALQAAGVSLTFAAVPTKELADVSAELVQPIDAPSGGKQLLALASCGGEIDLPESAEVHELPTRDRPTLRAEAAEIDASLKAGNDRLAELAHLLPAIQTSRNELHAAAEFTVASKGALVGDNLTALQGWAPADHADSLAADLATKELGAAVEASEATEDDTPPTLIHYPKFFQPIKALFDMLGTLPGYRELELSPFFMVALPIFAALLIGDAGYGLLFMLAPILLRGKLKGVQAQLVVVIGVATVIWGLLTGNIFGVTPQVMIGAGGAAASLGQLFAWCQVFPVGDEQITAIMKVSFVFAVIHLSLAQAYRALGLLPSLRSLCHVGWVIFLWGVFGLVWYLFFGSQASPPKPPHPAVPWLLIVGTGMAVLFASPSRNPLKMIGIGLASFPLSALGGFSDTISYIRLMGVGLASTIIGQTFNDLGAKVAGGATWVGAAPVLLFGHGLNIALCMIAILAHGVRLNMLEFSNNAGVTWAGHPYEPYTRQPIEEI
ncbi:MAG: V-type ATP synthase subunit I [Planctomycetota bacterium]